MQRLRERLEIARRAVASLTELTGHGGLSPVERDAAIQRFEYSVEAVWKAAQRYLRVVEGIEVGSPKSAVRGCFEATVLGEVEARRLLAMIDDRNLTVHTYNEALAQAIASRLSPHAEALAGWIAAVSERVLDEA
ncbi:MAG: nucleotidyltransferase substrate binding protein [Deltaproteobacteria bacterium]|nr:nucleotidyltransferase substrate binding protein [Deltaproteobacteria bacterium]